MQDMSQWLPHADTIYLLCSRLCMLTLAGIPLMALVGENLARTRQRSSYDKCARQLAVLGTILGLLLSAAGAWELIRVLSARQPDLVALWQNMSPAPLTLTEQARGITWVCLSFGVFFLALYAVLWKSLRNYPILHQILGLLATIMCFESVYGFICVLSAEVAVQEMPLLLLSDIFMPVIEAEAWNLLPYALPLSLSLAGAAGALWLLLRRNRDDYGRDHYQQMVPWCALWARNAWVVLWMIVVCFVAINMWYTRIDMGYLPVRTMLESGAQVLLWIIPALLWTIVCRSQTPLRHKLTMTFAFVLMCVCVASLTVPLFQGF